MASFAAGGKGNVQTYICRGGPTIIRRSSLPTQNEIYAEASLLHVWWSHPPLTLRDEPPFKVQPVVLLAKKKETERESTNLDLPGVVSLHGDHANSERIDSSN